MVNISEDIWGERLRNLKPKIKELWGVGDVGLLDEKYLKLAIVGSRRMTEYARRVIESWVPRLVNEGIVIVSGFMYGVDQMAHRVCIENGGKTIAVLGWGIDRPLYDEDRKLYEKFVEVDSLILSEYGGPCEAELWMFPARNRIVAGMVDAVWVVEAAEKSGSLITAKWAKKYGKTLLALPGPVTSKVSEGTNGLIARGDAKMVNKVEDILKFYKTLPQNPSLDRAGNGIKEPVTEVLEREALSAEGLAKVLRIPVVELMHKLTIMTLSGKIVERNGKFYIV